VAWTDMTALTGLIAWYKPETLAASYANGDPIDTWADSSGNSRDLTGTTTTRPLAAASAINGYMAADFDGTDDVLSSGSFSHISGNVVCHVVMNLDTLPNVTGLIEIHSSATPSHIGDVFETYLAQTDAEYRVGHSDGGNQLFYAETSTAVSTNYVLTTSYSASGAFCNLNGQPQHYVDSNSGLYTNAASKTAYIHLGHVGLTYFTDGKICEVIIYQPTALEESVWVEGYLADKYAITLPDGHLFKNAAPENAPTTYNAAGGATLASDARIERLK